jgi:catechol 2,3-dioxygenase-like lactoylglutathione lyase family enzyme
MSLASSGVTFALPVEDVDRAKKFYVESLGLEFTGTNAEGSALFSLGGGGAELMLLPRPGGQRSDSTAMTWGVEDIGQQVKELEAAGVTFEDYDTPEFKTVDHVADFEGEKAAWFLDPDGNVLCIHQGAG